MEKTYILVVGIGAFLNRFYHTGGYVQPQGAWGH